MRLRYRKATTRKRLRSAVRRDRRGACCRLDRREVNLSEVVAENFWRFLGLFRPHCTLESSVTGSWTDLAEWFWGLARWLRLLGDTLLIAYVGTLMGADMRHLLSAFCAAANLASAVAVVFVTGAFLEFCRTVPEHRLRADFRHRVRPRARCRACLPSRSIPPARSASCSPRSSRTST